MSHHDQDRYPRSRSQEHEDCSLSPVWKEAQVNKAEVEQAVREGRSLERADLRGADLRGAYLVGANLRGAYLVGANLEGADLRGANLVWANLVGADLRGAYLEGADLTNTILEKKEVFSSNKGRDKCFKCSCPTEDRRDFLTFEVRKFCPRCKI